MTPEQRRAVAKRTDPRLSEPQQWYNLFMTLFPRELLPKTPYLGTELQEITNAVRQYWRESRRSIITSVMRSHQRPKTTSPEGKDPPQHVAGPVEEIHRLSAEVFADAMDILPRSLYDDTSRKGPVSRPPYGTVIDVSRHVLDKERTSTETLQNAHPLSIGIDHDGDPAHGIGARTLKSTDDSQKPPYNQFGISDVTVNEVGPGLAEPEVDPELYLYSADFTFLTDTDLEGVVELDQQSVAVGGSNKPYTCSEIQEAYLSNAQYDGYNQSMKAPLSCE
ncbi:hypothetical protein CSOJ01_09469 [Colletotrichum sojae]|uniref:Uncharacterized protein n=1 Tax=Colletotrichum sojae TaxID=2175907 RepID=A0A8H6J3L6_9PEZI|nr:hypothetical protein CSOJ01_09469 [Colletotrichum sojae]